jgi:hypothetical protein
MGSASEKQFVLPVSIKLKLSASLVLTWIDPRGYENTGYQENHTIRLGPLTKS